MEMNRYALIRRRSVSCLFAMLITFPLVASASYGERWLTAVSVKPEATSHVGAGRRGSHVLRGKRHHKEAVTRRHGYRDEGKRRFVSP